MIRLLLRAALVLAAVTGIGQIPYKGVSLEWHYHEAINSEKFQNFFWTTVRPITWTSEKVEELWLEAKGRGRDAATAVGHNIRKETKETLGRDAAR